MRSSACLRDGRSPGIPMRFSAPPSPPDGKQVLTASRDRTARSRGMPGRARSCRPSARGTITSPPSALVFRDGRTLITAAADNTVRFWDIAAGTQYPAASGDRLVRGRGSLFRRAKAGSSPGATTEAAPAVGPADAQPRTGRTRAYAGRIAEPARLGPTTDGSGGRLRSGANLVATGDTNGRCLTAPDPRQRLVGSRLERFTITRGG